MKTVNNTIVSTYGNAIIKWRNTPWDSKVFNCHTVELLSIDCKNGSENDLFEGIKKVEHESKADFIYGRFSADDFFTKKSFINLKYFIAETTLKIYLNISHNYNLPAMYSKYSINVERATDDNVYELANISGNMYKFSRFHEDPYLDQALCNRRMSSWVSDLGKRKVPALIFRNSKQQIISYLFYEIEDKKVNWILGGSSNGNGFYTPAFLSYCIKHFRGIGINKIVTTISAANKGILGIYLSLGFNVSSVLYDYHKHIASE